MRAKKKFFSPNLMVRYGGIVLRFGKGYVGNSMVRENCFYETEMKIKIPLSGTWLSTPSALSYYSSEKDRGAVPEL